MRTPCRLQNANDSCGAATWAAAAGAAGDSGCALMTTSVRIQPTSFRWRLWLLLRWWRRLGLLLRLRRRRHGLRQRRGLQRLHRLGIGPGCRLLGARRRVGVLGKLFDRRQERLLLARQQRDLAAAALQLLIAQHVVL